MRLALVTGGIICLLELNEAAQTQEYPDLSPPGSLGNRVFGEMIMAFVVVAPMHFVLRSVTARRVWDGIIQTALDLRKA